MKIEWKTWGVEINEHFLENLLWAVVCLFGIIWAIKYNNYWVGTLVFIASQIIYF